MKITKGGGEGGGRKKEKKRIMSMIVSLRLYACRDLATLAQIPPPADPSPVPPPGQATDFNVTLGGGGELVLSWKAQHPAGSDRVVYFIGRKLPGESTFAIVGAVGEREFTDASVPSSAAGVGVTYQVTAQRGQVAGTPSVPITITFGIGGSGLTITSLSGAKLAA